jgi:hypothetical protein
VRAPGQGLWDSGGDIERDNIAVIEVMTDELDLPARKKLSYFNGPRNSLFARWFVAQ